MATTPPINHQVAHVSAVPANAGQTVQLYVREYDGTPPGPNARRKVVLMLHGRSVPSVVAFDLQHDGGKYSWAQYLAKAGFDVFLMELTGSGLSPRRDGQGLQRQPAASGDPEPEPADLHLHPALPARARQLRERVGRGRRGRRVHQGEAGRRQGVARRAVRRRLRVRAVRDPAPGQGRACSSSRRSTRRPAAPARRRRASAHRSRPSPCPPRPPCSASR